MREITISLSGNLTTEVMLQTTPGGVARAHFRVASNAQRYDRSSGRWVDGETSYWNVTVWRRAAENAAASLAKGHPVLLTGRVRQRVVDRSVDDAPGVTVPVTYTEVEATHVGLDLSRCRAQYVRAPIGPQTSDLAPSGARTGGAGEGAAAA